MAIKLSEKEKDELLSELRKEGSPGNTLTLEERESLKAEISDATSVRPDFSGGLGGPNAEIGPSPPEEETFLGSLKKSIPEIAGATVGGVAGGFVASPTIVGVPAGVIGGAALGAAAGSAGKQIFQQATDDPDAPKTSGEAARRIALEAAIGALSEFGGALAVKGGGKLLAPLKSRVTPAVTAVRESFKKFGGKFSAAQSTNFAIVDFFEAIAEGSLFGGGRFFDFRRAQGTALEKAEAALVKRMSGQVTRTLSDPQTGQLVVDTLKSGDSAGRAIGNKLYKELDRLVGAVPKKVKRFIKQESGLLDKTGNKIIQTIEKKETRLIGKVQVDFSDVLTQLRKLEDDALRGADTELATSLASSRRGMKEALSLSGDDLDDLINFSDADKIRSSISARIRDLRAIPGNERSIRPLVQVQSNITNLMDEAAEGLSGEAKRAWQKARSFHKLRKNTFNEELVGAIIADKKFSAERIGEAVFRDGNVEEVKALQRALRFAKRLDPSLDVDKTMTAMKGGYIEGILLGSSKATVTGEVAEDVSEISGKKLLAIFNNPKKLRTLNAAFSAEHVAALKEFAQQATLAQIKPKGPGTFAIMLAQGGAIIGLVSGEFFNRVNPGGSGKDVRNFSAGIFIAPWILGRIMTNPKTVKLLAEGYALSGTGKAITGRSGQIISAVGLNATQTAVEEKEAEEKSRISSTRNGSSNVLNFPRRSEALPSLSQ